jgi:uncharacterized Zn finger protein (UPF0148 family)
MPPMPQRQQQPAQRCPACGGEPVRGAKKGEPTCPVCHGGMSDSPAGKQALAQQAKAGAAKFKQAMAQRQQAGGGAQGMRPGIGAPVGQGGPQRIDPRALAMLAAVAQQQQRGGR